MVTPLALAVRPLSLRCSPVSPPNTSLLQTGIRLDRSVNAVKDLSHFIRSFKAIKGIRVTFVQRHTRHRAQSSSAQVSKANKHSSSMFGYSHSPAIQPCQASTWWSSPPGHAAVPSWQPPTDNHSWSYPPPSAPAWVRPATHIQIWGSRQCNGCTQAQDTTLQISLWQSWLIPTSSSCRSSNATTFKHRYAQHSLRNRTWC